MNKMYKEDPKLTCLLHKMNLKEYRIWTKLTKKIVEQCKKMEISDQCIYEIAKRHSDAFKYNGIGKKYYKQDGKEHFYYVPVGNNFMDKEGYSKEFGYYAARPFIGWDEIRHEEVLIKTKSEDEALKYFLFLDIIYASKLTSKIKEEELRKEWKYDVKFTREKFESEFIINAYNHVLSEDGINVFIEKDTIKLNKIAGKKYWMFDKDIMEFVPLKQTNIKNDSAIIIDYKYSDSNLLTEIHINEDEVRYYNGKNVFYNVEKYAKPAYIMDRISDKDFIEKMLICNAYLPHKERLMAMFYNVQKYSEEEFKKHLNLENINNNPGMLKIKDGQTEITLNMRNDLFDSKIVSAFVDDLKRTIEFYLNKNK